MSKGTDLWLKAKSLIPGGNQLLSKRSEMFLPGLWPSYYQKAKGCEIWDLDGKHYYDFAQMGVGSCILGYADEDVDRAVIHAIENGSMSTLNSWEEVELAKKLIELHPWGEMVRFARTGGEACAIAIRIARAATGRDKVAFCGYHGWHDWYISSNLGDQSNLDGQLLPGLEPRGVPRALKNTARPFNYNRLDELEKILIENRNEIGAIIMEPVRGTDPAKGFLAGVKGLADKHGAVLIFDEVTSGFRMNLGGIHLNYGVDPDIAVFGKALGNGFPISAIVGKRKYMDAAQESFISSTFWTERIGFVAALATLEKMAKYRVQEKLVAFGEKVNQGWIELSKRYTVPVEISGIKPLTHLSFKVKDPLAAQTLYTQEMLEQGFLLGASVYATYAYSDKVIDQFVEKSSRAFSKIKQAINTDDFKKYLKGPVKHAGFKRLT